MTINSSVSVEYIDPYRPYIPRVSGDRYEFNLSYTEVTETGTSYHDLSRHVGSTIHFPVDEITELICLKHLSAQAAVSNRGKYQTPVGGMNQLRVESEIDETVLRLIEFVFKTMGQQQDAFSHEPPYIKALLIHDVWGMNSIPTLMKYMGRHDKIAEQIGYADVKTNKSLFYKIDNQLQSQNDRQHISAAATRIVHALWRNGYPLPDQIEAAHDLNVDSKIDEGSISPPTRRAAIFNWIEKILPQIINCISFNRAQNTSYSTTDIVGSLAQAAMIDGVYSAEKIGGWHYSDEDLIGSRQLNSLLSDMTIRSINNMFEEVTQEFITRISELGFFNSEYDYAADTTWVNWHGDDMSELIDNPKRCETESGWCFAAVTCMNSDARFAFGIEMTTDKSNIVDHYERILTTIARNHRIKGVYMDREFTSGDAVEMSHSLTDKWVIRAKTTKGPIKDHLDKVSVGEPVGPKPIDFAGVTPKPKLYLHPLDEEHRDAVEETHMIFLVSREFDKTDRQRIYQTYQNRWNIETFFRQLKHDFSPQTKTKSSPVRLFLFNIASIFFNIHTLINRAPSPKYGLRLDVSYYEVLQAIVEFAFSREGPFIE